MLFLKSTRCALPGLARRPPGLTNLVGVGGEVVQAWYPPCSLLLLPCQPIRPVPSVIFPLHWRTKPLSLFQLYMFFHILLTRRFVLRAHPPQ